MLIDYTIPDEVLSQYNITFDEFLFLILQIRCQNLHSLANNLANKGIGKTCIYDNELLITSLREHKLVDKILITYKEYLRMTKQKVPINPDYIVLAGKMQELYPKGIRSGCSTAWRGNKLTIAKKLTFLATEYNISFTEEEALNAVKKYVEHFAGDYTYMECLEYFILRLRPDFKSNFLSYLENADQEDITDNNWTSTLK